MNGVALRFALEQSLFAGTKAQQWQRSRMCVTVEFVALPLHILYTTMFDPPRLFRCWCRVGILSLVHTCCACVTHPPIKHLRGRMSSRPELTLITCIKLTPPTGTSTWHQRALGSKRPVAGRVETRMPRSHCDNRERMGQCHHPPPLRRR
jgi:hypothetical protein